MMQVVQIIFGCVALRNERDDVSFVVKFVPFVVQDDFFVYSGGLETNIVL